MANEKIIYMKLSEIEPYENNPRFNEDSVDRVANSIKAFGFKQPIVVDANNVIIAGHTRYKAAKQIGLSDVPVIVASDLSEDEVKAYRLADNKVGEASSWDFEALNIELSELMDFDMGQFGFEFDSIGETSLDDIVEDEVPEVDEESEPTVKLGEVWQLGRHRLMCGDSTNKESVSLLMDGAEADMVFTDPPYNIAYSGVNDKRTIRNDKMSDEKFVQFLENSLMPCETMYVCCSWQYAHLFRKALENLGQKIKAMIVWDKVNPAQHLDKYFKQHELIWYCGSFGGEKTLRGDVWQCKRQTNTVHPTMKPIELIAMAIQDQPNKKIIYDGFGGSGSTLIACEQLDRTCYMMELDPKYCDVIIKRWENITGESANLVKGA